MGSAIGWLWFGIGALGIVDACLHSQSEWVAADRDRSYWVVMLFFFGPVAAVCYAVGVRGRFGRAADVSPEFRKS